MTTITKDNAAIILATLYNATQPMGLGKMHAKHLTIPMTEREAAEILENMETAPGYHSGYFDYLYGRPMKLDLTVGKELELRLFNRDAGDGVGEAALALAGIE